MGSGLVARNNELRRARHLLDDKGVVVLVGPPGVGKTAICDVLASQWAERGHRVVELRGIHGLKKVAFGAVTMGLRVAPGASEPETLARVIDSLTDGPGKTLVVVDDVHNIDDPSAGVVVGLAQASDIALIMVMTSGEPVPVDITSVWARWPDCRIEIGPLDEPGVAELLATLLPDPVTSELTSDVTEISLGYPLYVVTIAEELRNASEGGSSITFVEPGSDRLTSLMERRLARLDREERRLFDVVAFAEATSVQIVAGQDDLGLVDRLTGKGLVRVTDGRIQVAHPLLGSVARGTLTSDGQRSCAQHLLRNLSEGCTAADVASVVRKALANGLQPDPAHLAIATEMALSWGDYRGAARLAATAPDEPELRVLAARAARFLGETPPTEIPPGLDDDALTEYLSATSQGLAYSERRFTDAIDFLRDGMTAVSESQNRDRLALELMVLSGLVGDVDALLGAAKAVSSNADANTRVLGLSATQLAEALTLTTATSSETQAAGLDVSSSEEVADHLREQMAMARVMVSLAEGEFNEARSLMGEFQDKTLLGSWLTIEAVLAEAWLPIVGAEEVASAAVTALQQFDPLANLAQARILLDLRRAQRGTPVVPGDDSAHEPGVALIDQIMNRRVEAWLAWAEGDPTAGKQLAEVGREAIGLGHRFWGLLALIDATRLGLGDDVGLDIDHLVLTRGAGLAVLAGRHARAATADELWIVARSWWEAGAPVFALETAIRGGTAGGIVSSLGAYLMAGAGVAPLVGDMDDLPCPISERQLEIVGRVLDGESNEVIADGLFLSRRTVENHLHRVYSLLGLSDGRDELKTLFGWIVWPPAHESVIGH